MSVLMLGGAAAATPAFATPSAAHAKTTASKAKTSKTSKTKVITYRGYQFTVPASWPVYHLAQHPTTCVRLDVNAVYLGTPGLNMQCPAGSIGRANTIDVIPSVTTAAGSGNEVTLQRQQPDDTGNTRVRYLNPVHATLTSNAGARELRVALGAAALTATIVATYGQDPAAVERAITSLRVAPRKPSTAWTGSAATRQAAARAASAAATEATAAGEATAGESRPPVTASVKGWHGMPPDWPVQVITPPSPPSPPGKPPVRKPPVRKPPARKPTAPVHPVSGFDACTAPSLGAMRAWHRDFKAIGFYIGGQNTGCADGNVSRAWVRAILKMGWGAMPTYVGPQASCIQTTAHVWEISARYAAAEGRRWGRDAVRDARKLGIGRGSPLFYDMEAYDEGNVSCRRAVLTFLGAWDRAVAAAGYKTAVYSSAASGITDLQRAAAGAINTTAGYTAPDAIWIAAWDKRRTLTVRHLPLSWPRAYRSKQYAGNVVKTIGGYRDQVDLDCVGGPLAR